ncbi:hypothetical protein PSPO01_04247 [Paraphaeosphaeria sporulosa]
MYDHHGRPDGLLMKRCWQLAGPQEAPSAKRCRLLTATIPHEPRARRCHSRAQLKPCKPMSTPAALVYRDPSPQSQTRLQPTMLHAPRAPEIPSPARRQRIPLEISLKASPSRLSSISTFLTGVTPHRVHGLRHAASPFGCLGHGVTPFLASVAILKARDGERTHTTRSPGDEMRMFARPQPVSSLVFWEAWCRPMMRAALRCLSDTVREILRRQS